MIPFRLIPVFHIIDGEGIEAIHQVYPRIIKRHQIQCISQFSYDDFFVVNHHILG